MKIRRLAAIWSMKAFGKPITLVFQLNRTPLWLIANANSRQTNTTAKLNNRTRFAISCCLKGGQKLNSHRPGTGLIPKRAVRYGAASRI